MFKFTVYQYHIPSHVVDFVNDAGWDKAISVYPEVLIHREIKFWGSEHYESWMHEYFTPVAEITAKDLDGVFQIGNIGPADKIERLAERMHSVSIGDVILDQEKRQYFMVEPEGFKRLPNFLPEQETA